MQQGLEYRHALAQDRIHDAAVRVEDLGALWTATAMTDTCVRSTAATPSCPQAQVWAPLPREVRLLHGNRAELSMRTAGSWGSSKCLTICAAGNDGGRPTAAAPCTAAPRGACDSGMHARACAQVRSQASEQATSEPAYIDVCMHASIDACTRVPAHTSLRARAL